MTALSKFTYSVHTTSVLFPFLVFGIAGVLRMTDIDDWFVEHNKLKACLYILFGIIVPVIASVLKNKDVEKDVKRFALSLLAIPLLFIFSTINIELLLYLIFIFLCITLAFNFGEMIDDRRATLYIAIISTAFFVLIAILQGCFQSNVFEGVLCSYILFMMAFPYQNNREIINAIKKTPSYSWDNDIKRILAKPIKNGYSLAKNNFLLSFIMIGDLLGEADVSDK